MKTSTTLALALGLTAIVPGCASDNPKCKTFADHVADVVVKESADEVTKENREKIIETTLESCNGEPPAEAALDCGIAAATSEAIKACDKVEKAD